MHYESFPFTPNLEFLSFNYSQFKECLHQQETKSELLYVSKDIRLAKALRKSVLVS